MARVRGSGSKIERALGSAMWSAGIRYRKQYRKVPGRPDFAVPSAKLAIFCDSAFWHGKGWPEASNAIHTNREFWLPKIERNILRDSEVNKLLAQLGWTVLRFWENDILKRPETCLETVLNFLSKANESRNNDTNRSS
jgi:DNA mismatch endonuclease (patch repair protein)